MEPEYTLTKPYSRGFYNVVDDKEQHIRISEGCPNQCTYCAETWENGKEPIYYEIPELVRNKVVILDMNLIYKPRALEIIQELGQRRVNGKVIYYELQCGIDWRYLTQELASALKQARFENMRFAWDYGYSQVYKIYDALKMLIYAGYKAKEIQIFMICNWKIPYVECLKKLDTIKFWRTQISDCWYDNQLPPDIKPVFWNPLEILNFRAKCRDHNIMARMNGIQVEDTKE